MLTLFTDSYATLTDINSLMISTKEWSKFDDFEKEDFIKSATVLIDKNFIPTGTKSVESQPLSFPRDFGGGADVLFDLAAQTNKLCMAVYHQCQAFMHNIPAGKIDFTQAKNRKMLRPIIGIAPDVKMVLFIYKHDGAMEASTVNN